MRDIGGRGLPAEAVGVVDRARNDQPPERAQHRKHEHEQPKLGVDAKGLELVPARGNPAHPPAPSELEQYERRHRPMENLPDRGITPVVGVARGPGLDRLDHARAPRSEEHTSELQSLMRISYAVFCLTKKKH